MTVTVACLALLSFGYWGFLSLKVSPRTSILYFWLLLGAFFAVSAVWTKFFWIFALPFFLFWFLFFCFFLAALLVKWGKKGTEQPQALVLLGVRNDGTLPLELFSERVRLCAELMKEDPEVKAVLCGGRVFGERESEAKSMEKALVAMGIPEDRLLLEEKSRTTVENFSFLKECLGEEIRSVGVISSSFHRFRTCLAARAVLGDRKVCFYGAPIPAYFALHLYLREFFTFSVDLIGGRFSRKQK